MEGVKELMQWSEEVKVEDKVDKATQELKERGLLG